MINPSRLRPSDRMIGKFSIAFSATTVVIFVYLFFMKSENFFWPLRLIAIVALGFFIGFVEGALFGSSRYKLIGIGSFCGLFFLWLPSVLVTYGFSLMFVPVLLGYAAIFAIGARTSSFLIRRKT